MKKFIRWKSNCTPPEGRQFLIEHEILFDTMNQKDFPAYYLMSLEEDGEIFCNYLQEEFDIAVQQASRKFGVPADSWVQINADD